MKTIQKFGATVIGKYNRALILNSIKKLGPLSRTMLRKLTGIRMASITKLVKELIEEGYLLEAGPNGTEKEKGRKQILLKINPRNGFAVGVDFDADHVTALVTNLEARVVAQSSVRFNVNQNRNSILKNIFQTTGQVIKKSGCKPQKLLGIGVADPGIVDTQNGISVFSTTIENWRNVPLKKILEEKFSIPVCMEEGTRAKMLYEKRYGVAKEVDNLMFIDLGMGVGCGLIICGEIYRGATGSAGELGHMHVAENGPACKCGSYGCLETVASLPAIGRRAEAAIREGAGSLILELAGGNPEKISAEHVFEAGIKGDKLALRILDETSRYLGLAIGNAVNLLNPEMIVFGSNSVTAKKWILEPTKRIIQQQALKEASGRLKLAVSEIGDEAGALGAVTMVLDNVFEIPQLGMPKKVRC